MYSFTAKSVRALSFEKISQENKDHDIVVKIGAKSIYLLTAIAINRLVNLGYFSTLPKNSYIWFDDNDKICYADKTPSKMPNNGVSVVHHHFILGDDDVHGERVLRAKLRQCLQSKVIVHVKDIL